MSHTLIAMSDGNVLDWVYESGRWRLWKYNSANASDILPGDPIQQGQWHTITTGHTLMCMPDGKVLDWNIPDGSWRLYNYDPTQSDILTGPVASGKWNTIIGGHWLIPMNNIWYPSVLDWVPGDGTWRLWRYDASNPGDIFPGDPIAQGQWSTITTGHFLIPMDADGKVLDWVPADGTWRLWTFDPTNVGDIFPGDPVQQGKWNTITAGHFLTPMIGDSNVLDWCFDGTWRLYHYNYGSADILPGDPVAQGRWPNIADIFWRAHDPITFDNNVPVSGKSFLVIRSDGSYDYRGYFNNSAAWGSATPYNVADAWVVVNNGQAFSFGAQGTAGGDDFTWSQNGVQPELAGLNWDAMASDMAWKSSSSAGLAVAQVIANIKVAIGYVQEIVPIVQYIVA